VKSGTVDKDGHEEGQAGLAWLIDQVEAWLNDPTGGKALEQFSGVALVKKHF